MINPQIIKLELKNNFSKLELENEDDRVIMFLEAKGIRTMYLKYRLIELALQCK